MNPTKSPFITSFYYFQGVYTICFSNEFSTFSHKLVYMELNVGPEQQLPGIGDHATVLTQVMLTNYLPTIAGEELLGAIKFILL